MHKVIIIRSNSASPDPRVEKEADSLGSNNYEVTVLAWDRSCIDPRIEYKDHFKIYRIRLKAPYGKPILIIKLIEWTIFEIKYLLETEFDVVHCCDLDTLLPGIIVSRLKNKKIVYDCFDFYADMLTLKVPSPLRVTTAYIERFLASLADLVIIADDTRIAQFGYQLKDYIIINNSPAKGIAYSMETKMHQFQNIKKIKFSIFYGGILDVNRGFEHLFKAISDLKDVSLVIAGFGLDEHEILNMCNRMNNVNFIGKIKYKEIIQRTIESDLLVALYNPTIPNNKYASPNKLFEAMMCGKPILVSEGSSMADIVRKEECGMVVPYGDIAAIRDAILKLKSDPRLAEEMGRKGRKAYEKRYDWAIMEQKLINSYKNLLGGA